MRRPSLVLRTAYCLNYGNTSHARNDHRNGVTSTVLGPTYRTTILRRCHGLHFCTGRPQKYGCVNFVSKVRNVIVAAILRSSVRSFRGRIGFFRGNGS